MGGGQRERKNKRDGGREIMKERNDLRTRSCNIISSSFRLSAGLGMKKNSETRHIMLKSQSSSDNKMILEVCILNFLEMRRHRKFNSHAP